MYKRIGRKKRPRCSVEGCREPIHKLDSQYCCRHIGVCVDCGVPIGKKTTRCKVCNVHHQNKRRRAGLYNLKKPKFTRLTYVEELTILIQQYRVAKAENKFTDVCIVALADLEARAKELGIRV